MKDNEKSIFLASSLLFELSKNNKYKCIDNYLAYNNPDFNIEKNKILREKREDWLDYGDFIDKKEKKYFRILYKRLNKINNVNYSEEYWKQNFYIGFRSFITQVYETFQQIKSRFNYEKNIIKIIDQKSFFTPFDLRNLEEYYTKSEFATEQLFSIYVQLFYSDYKNKRITIKNNYKDSVNNNIIPFKTKIKLFLNGFLKIFNPKIILLAIHYDKSNIIKLLKESKFKIHLLNFNPFIPKFNKKYDVQKRKKLSIFNDDFDDFDKFFFRSLESFCPTVLLEYFCDANDYYESEVCKFKNTKYIVSEAWIANHQMCFFIAHLKNKGIKFISSEHKGLQHPFINSIAHPLINISDIYLSQGWYDKTYDNKSKLFSTGLLHKLRPSYKNIDTYKDKILYMTAPIYAKKIHYNGNSFFIGEDSQYFLKFQELFFINLKVKYLEKMVYRGPSYLKTKNFLVYESFSNIEKYINKMEIDAMNYSGIDAMNSSKLVIIDYLGSGYLEALLNNVPTVLFFYENCYLVESQKKIFEKLIDTGIMQIDPKKASLFVQKIEKDPLNWWLRDDVQKAKNDFITTVVGKGEYLESKLLSFLKN